MTDEIRTQYAIHYADGELEEMPDYYDFGKTMEYSRSLLEHDEEFEPGMFDHTVVSRKVTVHTEEWTPVFATAPAGDECAKHPHP